MRWYWWSLDDNTWELRDLTREIYVLVEWWGDSEIPDPLLPAWRGTVCRPDKVTWLLDPSVTHVTLGEAKRLAQEAVMEPLELLALLAAGGLAPHPEEEESHD